MIYDCFVRQKKCHSILKHVLKRCDNRKSCRRPVVSLSHATKSYRVNRPLGRLPQYTVLAICVCHMNYIRNETKKKKNKELDRNKTGISDQ